MKSLTQAQKNHLSKKMKASWAQRKARAALRGFNELTSRRAVPVAPFVPPPKRFVAFN
jgi:hypothetical protein